MAKFTVWDPLNDTEAEAKTIDALDTESAAEVFAEQDVLDSGTCDAYAHRYGHDLRVRAEGTTEVVTVAVRIEYEPTFIGCTRT